MCSIFGMLFLNGAEPTVVHRGILTRLMIAGQVRGRDATGLSFAKEDGAVGYKYNVPAADFLNLENTSKIIDDGFDTKSRGKLYSVIGHTRQQTQGSHTRPGNNHPIKCGTIIGVHNGHIGNDASIFDWLTLTSHGVLKRQAEVDSEAIFAMIKYYSEQFKKDFHSAAINNQSKFQRPVVDAIIRTVPRLRGSLACAMQDIENPKALWLFRTSNPTTVKYFKDKNTIIFASTDTMIEAATKATSFSNPENIQIGPNQGLCFNAETNTYNRFDVESGNTLSY